MVNILFFSKKVFIFALIKFTVNPMLMHKFLIKICSDPCNVREAGFFLKHFTTSLKKKFGAPFSTRQDFVRKRSENFPTRRISSGSVPGTFRRVGFRPEAFRKLSDASDFVRKRSGSFPTRRISSGSV
jgi:hypothetical protein